MGARVGSLLTVVFLNLLLSPSSVTEKNIFHNKKKLKKLIEILLINTALQYRTRHKRENSPIPHLLKVQHTLTNLSQSVKCKLKNRYEICEFMFEPAPVVFSILCPPKMFLTGKKPVFYFFILKITKGNNSAKM